MTGTTDGVVQALRGLIATHGVDRVTTDAAWVRNVLADLSPETRALNRVLMFAVQESIPADLQQASTGGSVSLAVARGVNRLVGDYAIDRGIATDAVNAWARVLASAETVTLAPVPQPVPPATPPSVAVQAPTLSTWSASRPVAPPAPRPSRGSPSPVVKSSSSPVSYQNTVTWRAKARLALTLGVSAVVLLAFGDGARQAFLWRPVLWHANLSHRNLSGADLSGANLSKANLSGADLSGANLSKANLSGADLSGANLSNANLSGADLRRADLSESNPIWANLSAANLSEANLRGTNLSQADLSAANLHGADLRKADLSGAHLREADLTFAILMSADLSWADMTGAKLDDAIGYTP